MQDFVQDVRLGLRRLARCPGFSIVSIGILAFGLSASTSVYAYINAFFQPFPGADAADLLRVHHATPERPFGNLSYPDYLDLAASMEASFAGVEGVSYGFAASVRHPDLAEVVFGGAVTGGFFDLLRVDVARGHGLTKEDDRPAAPPAVVISHAYWTERFGAADSAVGQTLILNGNPYAIAGVAGPEFIGTTADVRPDVWFTFEEYKRVYWARSDRVSNRQRSAILPLVRLRDGVSARQAAAALASFGAGLDATSPLEDGPRRFTLDRATWVHPSSRLSEMPTARIMFSAAAGLLLLACVNVANLMLSLVTRREREVALRAALGASRGRLLRLLLTESLLLGISAGVVALAMAGPASSWIGSFFAQPSVWGSNVPRVVRLDASVFAFAFFAAVATGVATGLLPALRASRRDLIAPLRVAAGSSQPSRILRLDDFLISAQVALSLALLVVACLVLRTLDAAQDIDPGFRTDSVVASYVTTSSIGTPVEERHQFFRQLAERLRALSWVRAVAVTDYAPLSPHTTAEVRVDEEGRLVPVPLAKVIPGYFEALDIPLVAGRKFELVDTADTKSVVIVNETMATRFFGDASALGRQISWRAPRVEGEKMSEIVGVVEDTRLETLMGEAEPHLYVAYPQVHSTPGNAVLVSARIDSHAAVPLLEAEYRAVDPRMAVVNVVPYSEVLRGFVHSQRMNAELFTVVAVLGLILAAVGIFGVTSLSVGLRTREIGIRIAIGAAPGDIARLIMLRVVTALGLGMTLGLVASIAAAQWTESLLYGVTAGDLPSFASATLTLAAAAGLAAYLPTRRALAVNPARSLASDHTKIF